MTRPCRKWDLNPEPSALEADALPLGQRGGLQQEEWTLLATPVPPARDLCPAAQLGLQQEDWTLLTTPVPPVRELCPAEQVALQQVEWTLLTTPEPPPTHTHTPSPSTRWPVSSCTKRAATGWLVGWLFNVPATGLCISGTDLLKQFYVIEVADPTFYLTQSQYTHTGPTSPSADPITPGAWQGSHWSANFEVTGMTRPRENPGASGIRTWDFPLSRRTP